MQNTVIIKSALDGWKQIYECLFIIFPKELCGMINEYVLILWFDLPYQMDHLCCTYLTDAPNQILLSAKDSKDFIWLLDLSDEKEKKRFSKIYLPKLKKKIIIIP